MSEVQYVESTKHKLKINDKQIKGLTSVKPEFSGSVETFYTLESEGWQEAFKTGNALKLTCSGKRKIGDEGQDAVAALVSGTGTDVIAPTTWELPDGTTYTFNGVYDVKNIGGGEGNAMDTIEFDIYCNGKPTKTPGSVSQKLTQEQKPVK